MNKKYKYSMLIGVISLIIVCFLVSYILTIGLGENKVCGKWYLYTGNDINTEKNISTKLNLKDYIYFSLNEFKEYRSDGKNGNATYIMKGKKTITMEIIGLFIVKYIKVEMKSKI